MSVGTRAGSPSDRPGSPRDPWTPGPWEWVDQGAQEGDLVGPGSKEVICFGHDYDEYGLLPGKRAEANARLIALAPEMAELLEKLATWFETAPTYPPGWMGAKDVPKNARQARDLLARARNEAS